jgi:hypothetical protein
MQEKIFYDTLSVLYSKKIYAVAEPLSVRQTILANTQSAIKKINDK